MNFLPATTETQEPIDPVSSTFSKCGEIDWRYVLPYKQYHTVHHTVKRYSKCGLEIGLSQVSRDIIQKRQSDYRSDKKRPTTNNNNNAMKLIVIPSIDTVQNMIISTLTRNRNNADL